MNERREERREKREERERDVLPRIQGKHSLEFEKDISDARESMKGCHSILQRRQKKQTQR